MADAVTLAEAKLHLRVTQDDEDDVIEIYIAAATARIRNFLNRRIPGEDYTPANVPAPIKAAALLIITGLYENRADKTDSAVKENPAVLNLLYPYRVEIGI